MTPNESLIAAYAAQPPSDSAARKLASQAGTFRADSQLEYLLSLKSSDPAGYAALSPSLHMSVGYYSNSKSAAEAVINSLEGNS